MEIDWQPFETLPRTTPGSYFVWISYPKRMPGARLRPVEVWHVIAVPDSDTTFEMVGGKVAHDVLHDGARVLGWAPVPTGPNPQSQSDEKIQEVLTWVRSHNWGHERAVHIEKLVRENAALKAQVAALETLRPHWAQGYSDDSVAAQTTTAALSSLWGLLGAINQTDAVAILKELKAKNNG